MSLTSRLDQVVRSHESVQNATVLRDRQHTVAELNEMIGGVPDGYAYSKKCQGLQLVAGECDKFHVFWNKRSKSLDWWRL
jgi:hypothetical protein